MAFRIGCFNFRGLRPQLRLIPNDDIALLNQGFSPVPIGVHAG